MRRRVVQALYVVWCLGLVLGILAHPAAADPDSKFDPANFTGVNVTKSLQGSTWSFDLSIASGAKLLLGANSYEITGIQGFYLLSSSGKPVTGVNKGNSQDWTFDTTKQNSFVGWVNNDNPGRLKPGTGSLVSSIQNLSIGSSDILYGFHINYIDDSGKVKTHSFSGPTSTVPEPSSLFALVGCLGGLGGLMKIRRK
jgi:hypothetical protein